MKFYIYILATNPNIITRKTRTIIGNAISVKVAKIIITPLLLFDKNSKYF